MTDVNRAQSIVGLSEGRPGTNHCTETDQMILEILEEKYHDN